jgi:HlyD family secretion protein
MKKVLLVLAIVAAAGFGLWYFLTPKQPAVSAAAAAGPVTVEAKKGAVSIVVEGAAIMEPFNQVTLRSPAASILTFVARSGETLPKGGVVASLDDGVLRNTLGQAEILLAQAEVDLQRAKIAAERSAKDMRDKKTLLDAKALSPDQYTIAEETLKNADLALESAGLKVKQAKLSVDKSRRDLLEAKIRAPFAGTVLKTFVEPGDLASPNTAVALFGDVSKVRLTAEVDEFDIGKVAVGQSVTVSGDSVGTDPIRAKIDMISPIAEIVSNIAIFPVSAVVANSEGRLRPGMSADFSILIKSDKGLVVPAKSVSTVRGRSYIEVVENGEVVKKRVEKGADDGINVVILEGLEEGAKVVVPGVLPVGAPAATQAEAGKSVLPNTIPGTGGAK